MLVNKVRNHFSGYLNRKMISKQNLSDHDSWLYLTYSASVAYSLAVRSLMESTLKSTNQDVETFKFLYRTLHKLEIREIQHISVEEFVHANLNKQI